MSDESNAAVVAMFHARAKPGQEDRLNKLLEEAVAHTKLEPGNLACEFHRHETEEREFIMIERWASKSDYDVHLARPHAQQLNVSLGDCVEHSRTDVTSILR